MDNENLGAGDDDDIFDISEPHSFPKLKRGGQDQDEEMKLESDDSYPFSIPFSPPPLALQRSVSSQQAQYQLLNRKSKEVAEGM